MIIERETSHEKQIDLSKCPTWKGEIDELWFDPCAVVFTKAWIDWMRLEPGASRTAGIVALSPIADSRDARDG